jgi:hypothetical protein
MGINEGSSAQSTDLGVSKLEFSASLLGHAFDVDSIPPGFGNAAGTGAAPAFGDKGALVQVVNPQYPAFLSKMLVQYMPSHTVGDAGFTLRFTLFVQRNTLLNAAAVANGAPAQYGAPALAPVAVVAPLASGNFGIGTGAVVGGPAGSNSRPPAYVAGATQLPPLQASVDVTQYGGDPWQTVEGDVYYCLIETFNAAGAPTVLAAGTPLANVMVSVS